MYQTTLVDYEKATAACRFCPMCKPASEVANVTCIESYSTRSRAVLLWRWLKGIAEPTKRDSELLYQSTLDSISESWCVSHYPVSAYSLAARRRMVAEKRLPAPVESALNRVRPDRVSGDGPLLFVAGEIWELEDRAPFLSAAESALESLGLRATMAVLGNGVIDFTLGDNARARSRGEALARVIEERRPERILVDGPDTLFALTKLYPGLGLKFPMDAACIAILDSTADHAALRSSNALAGARVLCHDARSTTFLADSLSEDGALQPGFTGPESVLGHGAIFDSLRAFARVAGAETIDAVWTRTLSKSSGADDGLWLTYPKLADRLGNARIEYARQQKASVILTASPLAAAHLRRLAVAQPDPVLVHWTGELLGAGIACPVK